MPAPTPVLLMVRELNLGGSERQMAEMAKALDRSRFDPRVGCFRPAGLRGDELRAAGVPIVHFPVPSMLSVKGAMRIGAYIREQGIRLVHTFDTPANLYGVPAARMAGCAVVFSSQRVHRSLWPLVQRQALRVTDRMVDGIVVNCEFMRRHMRDEEKAPAGLIHLCYNGIDTGVFRPDCGPRPEALRDASLVVGVVCGLRPEKGLETLLEAFAAVRVCSRHETGHRRQWTVPGGIAGPRASAGHSGRLRVRARHAVCARMAAPIDIFVLPSLSEALSNALMEAMACGCCVVASRVGGNPELVTDGETGMLFEPRDAAGLAEALRLLLANQALRGRLGRNAAELMRDRYSLAPSARRMGEIYAAGLIWLPKSPGTRSLP